MARLRLLFVCTGNSARSQMAEGFARYYGGNRVWVESAGIRPAGVHPQAVWVMNEVGIDISQQRSEALAGKHLADFDRVVTLCGDARDNCPPLSPGVESEHWDLPDPSSLRGSPGEVHQAFVILRYRIERKVLDLLGRLLCVR